MHTARRRRLLSCEAVNATPTTGDPTSWVLAKAIVAAATLWGEGGESEDTAQEILTGLPHPDTIGVVFGLWLNAAKALAEVHGTDLAGVLKMYGQDIAENCPAEVDDDKILDKLRELRRDPFEQIVEMLWDNGWLTTDNPEPPEVIESIAQLIRAHDHLTQRVNERVA